MKTYLCLPLLAMLMGCANFATNTFRAEQTAVDLAYNSYTGYTNVLPTLRLTAEQVAEVKDARLKLGASLAVLDGWRKAYETNAVNESYVQAALDAVRDNSSNMVWVINYFRIGAKP